MYRNSAARPKTEEKKDASLLDEDLDATQPMDSPAVDDDLVDPADPIQRIRQKRKAAEQTGPEPKRNKVDVKDASTVLVVIHANGFYNLRTNKFVCK